MSSDALETRFRRLYHQHYEALLEYAARRSLDLSDAHDVVADTFLVLWRRFDVAPAADEEILLWLYGVVRKVLSNRDRARQRRDRLAMRFAQIVPDPHDTEELAANRLDARRLLDALLELTETQREVLLLAAWEGLSTLEVAAVLGCSENAASIRLHRARKRLTEVYEKENARSGHIPDARLRLRRPPDQQRKDD
ncbi:MAG: RNA polymerase sigma factor [Gaiellaceae bacterium]